MTALRTWHRYIVFFSTGRTEEVSPRFLNWKLRIQNSRETFRAFFLCLHTQQCHCRDTVLPPPAIHLIEFWKTPVFSVGCICSSLHSSPCQLKTRVHPSNQPACRPASNSWVLQTLRAEPPASHQRTTANLLQPKRALGWVLWSSMGTPVIRVRGQLNQILTLIPPPYPLSLPTSVWFVKVRVSPSVSLSHFTVQILFLSLSKRASEKED